MATEKQIAKARITHNTFCKKASKCRHESYRTSCCSCPIEQECDIQNRIKDLLKIIRNE